MNDRNQFVELLEQAYGITSENGYDFNFKEKGLTKKEVAEDLYYDDAQFGKMFKANFTGYYNNAVARLKLKIRLNEAEEKAAKGIREEVEKELGKRSRQRKLQWFLFGMISAGILLSFIYGSFLSKGEIRDDISVNKNKEVVASNDKKIDAINEEVTSKRHSIILDPSFEEQENAHYGNNWKNKTLGGLIQLTKVIIFDGESAAKLPASGDRIGYQQINVLKNRDYILSFYYTMRYLPEGNLTVSVLKGKIYDPLDIEKATINSITLYDQSDENNYKQASLKFNSGDNSILSIYFTNEGVQCRLDAFNLEML